MRIYVFSAPDQFAAIAPDIPGSGLTGHETRATRDEAIERCRAFVASEIAAYQRLGVQLPIEPKEDLIDWNGPWWLVPEYMIPIRPRELRSALARMDDLASELEAAVAGLAPEQMNARIGTEWSAATTLDHTSHGVTLGIQQLVPLPLEPVEAQAAAVSELIDRLRASVGRSDAFLQFGMNAENGRVRWTPRKVARSVRAMQDAWSRYARDGGTPPRPPFAHDDGPDDDVPLGEADLTPILAADEELRPAAAKDPTIARICIWYRYYRDRLVRWPDDPLMRWRAMYTAFRDRIASAEDADLARVYLAPHGVPVTVKSELRLAIGHVLGHLAQIRAAAGLVAV